MQVTIVHVTQEENFSEGQGRIFQAFPSLKYAFFLIEFQFCQMANKFQRLQKVRKAKQTKHFSFCFFLSFFLLYTGANIQREIKVSPCSFSDLSLHVFQIFQPTSLLHFLCPFSPSLLFLVRQQKILSDKYQRALFPLPLAVKSLTQSWLHLMIYWPCMNNIFIQIIDSKSYKRKFFISAQNYTNCGTTGFFSALLQDPMAY